jgi:hypothetical protein
MGIGVETWILPAVVIVLGAIVVDRTRAYRALPALLGRLRRRSRAAGSPPTLGVDSNEPPPVRIDRSDFTGTEKGHGHGEGHQRHRWRDKRS